MATVFDVACYILERQGEITVMKLQKLVYYSQAWSLVWSEAPLFPEKIEAWANGPVVPALYDAHKGQFTVRLGNIPGSAAALNGDQRETIEGILRFYGDKTAQWLSDLTHLEAPWKDARERAGVSVGERSSEVITIASMHEYYSSL